MSSCNLAIPRAVRTACAVLVFALAGSATGQAASKVGWLWADQPNASNQYTPNSVYSFNSAGGAITVKPISTGFYEVILGKLYSSSPSNVQVSAFGTNGYCVSAGWGGEDSGKSALMGVRCFNAAGLPANSYFTLLYQDRHGSFGGSAKGFAFLWADQPTASNYTPNANYNYNSTATLNTVTRNGVGNYTVVIPGLSKQGGDVQVTGYSTTATPVRCKSAGWGSFGSGTLANVVCFDGTGAPADALYSFAFALNEPFGYVSAGHSLGAYAWANKPGDEKIYTPSKTWNFSSFGTGRMTSQKLSTGFYEAGLPGNLSYSSSVAFATAFDEENSNAYCNIDQWYPIVVDCYAQGGAEIDSEFDVTFQTAQ